MTAALGRNLILLSLLLSTSGAIVAFAAARRPFGLTWARRLAYAYGWAMVAANAVMVYALLVHDFSVSYVAQVGSRATPTWVTVVSLWSSLEGSILFWGGVLGIYIMAATFATRGKYEEYMPFSIGVWLACATFFSFLIAGPAQPFHTVLAPPMDGPGPNPLLQNHVLMAIHPPFLYLGYVGMTIPFGFASAALMMRRFGHDFLKPVRTWLIVPWAFLSMAIVLGGWWAYEVLGWGGYWAWDPVENASFLPWLTATAALHSAIVMQRKGTLKAWTITLVMSTFLLVILGTFMTRSGVFNSVHSFTQSSIGPTILGFLALALVWTVGLLATNIDKIEGEPGTMTATSREAMFLVNNLLFVLFTLTVLIGTVFPLVVEAVQDRQISVGRPYFDRMAVPIGTALLFLLGVGPALPWGRATKGQLKKALLPPIIGGVIILALGLLAGSRNAWTLITLFLAGYAGQITMRELFLPLVRRIKAGEPVMKAAIDWKFGRGRRRFGSYVIHASVVVIIASIAVSSTMKQSVETQLAAGQSAQVGEYTMTFLGAEQRMEDHRQATIGHVAVYRDGKLVANMEPRMNHYFTQREPIGTPDVHTTFGGDLYLSIMNIDPGTQTIGLHALINPMVGWIWIATGTLALGSIFLLLPGREKQVAEAAVRSIVTNPAGRSVPPASTPATGDTR